jgi:hypothetical protein
MFAKAYMGRKRWAQPSIAFAEPATETGNLVYSRRNKKNPPDAKTPGTQPGSFACLFC